MARFSHSGGIELEGTSAGLRRLAAILRRVEDSIDCQLTVPADRQARPYDGFLAKLRLDVTSGPMRICRDTQALRLEGSPDSFVALAHYLEFLVSSAPGPEAIQGQQLHVHVDYYEGHPFLSDEAEPLTIVLH